MTSGGAVRVSGISSVGRFRHLDVNFLVGFGADLLESLDLRVTGIGDEGPDPGGIGDQQLQIGVVIEKRGKIDAQLVVQAVVLEADLIRVDEFGLETRQVGLRWEDAPGSTGMGLAIDPGQATLLGAFTVPRGRESGSIFFESEELAAFLRADTTGQAGFLIVTTSVPVDDWGRVHAFAASTHPLAAGPVLELDLAPKGR